MFTFAQSIYLAFKSKLACESLQEVYLSHIHMDQKFQSQFMQDLQNSRVKLLSISHSEFLTEDLQQKNNTLQTLILDYNGYQSTDAGKLTTMLAYFPDSGL